MRIHKKYKNSTIDFEYEQKLQLKIVHLFM